jgi:PBP4 family serine-type D-alanyl-D-alanine carboxypeptidase
MMRADAPAVSGLTVNGGYADLVVKAGKPMLLPRNFGMAIKRGRADGEPSVRRSNGSWTVRVDGNLPADDDDFATVSLPDPALCAANILAGKATRKRLPAPPPTAKKFERAVSEVLLVMLKQSDNHAAETMLRLTGLNLGGDGSWDSALAKQAAWLRKIGIDSNEFRIADGSGLSRFTEITPRGLIQALEWTLRHENGQLFEAAMCAPGEGTLRNRLAGIDLRAKTGTLTGVCSLVGFVDTRTKRRILFAIIFNHYDGLASSVRPIQDELVRRLAAIESRPAPASLPR